MYWAMILSGKDLIAVAFVGDIFTALTIISFNLYILAVLGFDNTGSFNRDLADTFIQKQGEIKHFLPCFGKINVESIQKSRNFINRIFIGSF